MIRLAAALIAAGLTTTAAEAACHQVPLTETPKALIRAFSQRMEQVGAGDWNLATRTARGPMYFSLTSQVRLVVKDADGLAEEAGVLLSEPTPADSTRFEVASTFLGAHISGAPESTLQPRIVRAIADTKKTRQTQVVREGETTLVFSSPEPNAVVVISGRMRCD